MQNQTNKPYSRKRGRSSYSPAPSGSAGSAGSVITLNMDVDDSIDNSSINGQNIKTLESPVVVNHLKNLGKDYKTTLPHNVFLKLEIGIPEATYIEAHHDEITTITKDNFALTDFTISDSVAGAVERILTLNGDIKAVVKSALYLSFRICVLLNNSFLHHSYTLKSPNYKLVTIESDELTSNRLRQIEQKAKFSSLTYLDVCKPHYYNLKITFLKLELIGSFKSLFEFLYFVIETSDHKYDYLEDGKIHQIPIIHADDSNLYQPQEFNSGKIINNVNDTVKFIYNKEFIQDNQLV